MFEDIIKKLRLLNEETKKIWLVMITVLIMLLVIYIWLGYFNNLIAGLSEQQIAGTEQVKGFSFWQTMRAGAAAIYESFLGIFSAPKEYMIKP